jgi:DNA-binding protein YbaB
MDFNSLMKTAQKLQQDMEEKESALKEKQYTSINSIVRITMNGDNQVIDLELNDQFVKDFTYEDKEFLQEALILAINDLTQKQIPADKDDMYGSLAGSLDFLGVK